VQFALGVEDVQKPKVRVSVGGGQLAGQIPHVEGVL